MTKADLVEQIAEAIGPGVTKRDCADVVDGFLEGVKRALVQGDRIEIRGFGTFSVREHKARTARNPKTGEAVKVPARTVPGFKPSKLLRARVANGPQSTKAEAPQRSQREDAGSRGHGSEWDADRAPHVLPPKHGGLRDSRGFE